MKSLYLLCVYCFYRDFSDRLFVGLQPCKASGKLTFGKLSTFTRLIPHPFEFLVSDLSQNVWGGARLALMVITVSHLIRG